MQTLQRDTKSRLRVLCAHCTYACRYLEMWEAANQTLLAADRIKGCSRPDELKGYVGLTCVAASRTLVRRTVAAIAKLGSL